MTKEITVNDVNEFMDGNDILFTCSRGVRFSFTLGKESRRYCICDQDWCSYFKSKEEAVKFYNEKVKERK